MANIEETIKEVEKLNPLLAKDLTQYVKEHSYGLVFEENLPDVVRLYSKKIFKGDNVHIMPVRGKEDKDENRIIWHVDDLSDGIALLSNETGCCNVPVEDIVPVVGYKDVIYPSLKEVDRIENGNPNDPYHVVINSENYHALEMLAYTYAGQVSCIYIDPPYNTGNKDWKYNNCYVDSEDKYSHSKWLTFMKRRLRLAKELLNPQDSILIVTIDEKEYLRLGLLLAQIYPDAKIQMITNVINPSGVSRQKEFARVEEYIFFVMIGNASINYINKSMLKDDQADTATKEKIVWKQLCRGASNNGRRIDRPNLFYPLYFKKGTNSFLRAGDSIPLNKNYKEITCSEDEEIVWPISKTGAELSWNMQQTTLIERYEKGFVNFKNCSATNFVASYLTSGQIKKCKEGDYIIDGYDENGVAIVRKGKAEKVRPYSVWIRPEHNAGQYGTNILNAVFNEKRFNFPKSLYAVKDCLAFACSEKPNALIVDFFAGSGTTLHAVNLLNAEDGGHRRCICVTNNEVSSDEEKTFIKKGLRPTDEDWQKYGIARYVTWIRSKCCIEGKNVNGEPLKGEYLGKGYPDGTPIQMSDGFKSNAIFFELGYESAFPIRLDRAFNAIAPVLWMQAGCEGKIIEKRGKGYATTDNYGVLFNYAAVTKFVEAVKSKPSIKHIFVVTDDQKRFTNVRKRLPMIEPQNIHRLYESYLKSFEILGEGGLD